MTNELKHTPTPWYAVKCLGGQYYNINVKDCPIAHNVASVHDNEYLDGDAEANAKHIVKCVNEHEALTAKVAELEAQVGELVGLLTYISEGLYPIYKEPHFGPVFQDLEGTINQTLANINKDKSASSQE